jgi:hypothetical protein
MNSSLIYHRSLSTIPETEIKVKQRNYLDEARKKQRRSSDLKVRKISVNSILTLSDEPATVSFGKI